MGRPGNKTTGSKESKTRAKAGAKSSQSRKTSVSKSKVKLKSKQTKAQIEKLNMNDSAVADIHAALSTHGQAPKQVNTLDAQSLRDGMKKDQQTKLQSEKAEKDLASQLELITGMAL